MEIININIFYNFYNEYREFIFLLGTISLIIFFISLLSIKWLAAVIPEDYFIERKPSNFKINFPISWFLLTILKNIFGYLLIFGGIMMLVLPGQGILTICLGLILSNYPGKYNLERKIIRTPNILKTLNWLRKKSNKKPLKIN